MKKNNKKFCVKLADDIELVFNGNPDTAQLMEAIGVVTKMFAFAYKESSEYDKETIKKCLSAFVDGVWE